MPYILYKFENMPPRKVNQGQFASIDLAFNHIVDYAKDRGFTMIGSEYDAKYDAMDIMLCRHAEFEQYAIEPENMKVSDADKNAA